MEFDRNSAQLNVLKVQNKTTVAMSQLIEHVIPKKNAIKKYKESKSIITAMIASGEMSNEVAHQLLKKLDNDLMNSSII